MTLADLVPPGVVVREHRGPLGPEHEGGLLPAELPLAAQARERRRRELATGRRLARAALTALGEEAVPLLPDALRAPQWPEGVVGSITHADGLVAAAVGCVRADLRALGIDAEPDLPLPADVVPVALTVAEQARGPDVARLLFSLKEAAYKAWSPWTASTCEPLDLDVVLLEAGVSKVRLPDGVMIDGRWARRDGLIVCAAWA